MSCFIIWIYVDCAEKHKPNSYSKLGISLHKYLKLYLEFMDFYEYGNFFGSIFITLHRTAQFYFFVNKKT